MRGMKQRILILIATLAVAAFVVPASFAGSPSKTQYPSAAVLAKAKSKKPSISHKAKPLPTAKSSGTLPFTGANLAFMAGIGALAVGGGLALRTVGRRRSE